MIICPVCRKKMENGRLCTECGHDESRNIENYLSLVKISGTVKILSEEVEAYQNKVTEARFYALMENRMKGYESHIRLLENQLSQQQKRLDELEKTKFSVDRSTAGREPSRQENLNDLVKTLGGSVGSNAQGSREMPKESWNKGGVVTFGKYKINGTAQEPIEWLVVERQGNKCLLLSRYGLDIKVYNDTYLNTTWEGSDIRSWLNDTFYRTAFNLQERQRIITATLDKTLFSPGTNDNVFLLSKAEIHFLKSEEDRKAEPTKYARNAGFKMEFFSKYGKWWLRDQGTRSTDVAFVNVNGDINETGMDVRTAGVMVRPAMWVICRN